MIYVTGDWHLGHKKIIELAHRPEDFEMQILKNHLPDQNADRLCQRGETLIHLGDIALGRQGLDLFYEYCAFLRSQSINLIACRGNHDAGLAQLMGMGFHFACDSFTMKYMGKTLIFSHEPEMAGLLGGPELNIHGHLHHIEGHHEPLLQDGHHILISMELMQYRPIRLDTLIKLGKTPKWERGRFVGAV